MAAQDQELLAGGGIPEPGGLVRGRGEHARAVGREHGRVDRILMAAQDLTFALASTASKSAVAAGASGASSRTSWTRSKASSPRSIAVTASPALVCSSASWVSRRASRRSVSWASRSIRAARSSELDEGAQNGIVDEIGGGAQQILGLTQAGAGWDQLLSLAEASQRAKASSSSRRVRRCGPRSRASRAAPASRREALRGPARSWAEMDHRQVTKKPCIDQCIDQLQDIGIRGCIGSSQRACGWQCHLR